MKERYAGILLPITALPSPYGVGTLGANAKGVVDFLVRAKQKVWQVLPLVPTGYGDSPYPPVTEILHTHRHVRLQVVLT